MSVFVKTQAEKHSNDTGRIKVATEQVRYNQHLFNQFQAILHRRVKGLQLADNAVLSVYTEFSIKLCNIRLNEFIDMCRQTVAAEKGKATLAGQNLRDSLLSQHVNLKLAYIYIFLEALLRVIISSKVGELINERKRITLPPYMQPSQDLL